MLQREVKVDLAAHAQSDQCCAPDAEVVKDSEEVVLVAERCGRQRRSSQASRVVPDRSVAEREFGEHAVPQAAVMHGTVKQDHGRSVTGLLGPQAAVAGDGDVRDRHAIDSITLRPAPPRPRWQPAQSPTPAARPMEVLRPVEGDDRGSQYRGFGDVSRTFVLAPWTTILVGHQDIPNGGYARAEALAPPEGARCCGARSL